MHIENGKIENQTRLLEDLTLHGMWVGNCTVTGGAHLQLHGTVTGDLIVDEGSTASVEGMVHGNLTAIGRVDLVGMVMGWASGENLRVSPGAHIGRSARP